MTSLLIVDYLSLGQQARRSTGWRRVGTPLVSQEEEFRDYWVEGRRQRLEPYQNADYVADRLVRLVIGAAPCYTPPPKYVDPPEYYVLPDYVDSD